MEGDKIKDDKKKENQKNESKKYDDEVKLMIKSTTKDFKTKITKEYLTKYKTGHNLNTVNYNFRNKYKPYHDRDYVYYYKDYAAYNYRGYDIKEPKVEVSCKDEKQKEKPMRWVQYMTHVEKHPKKPPLMQYSPDDNSFVLIVLLALLVFLIINMSVCFLVLNAPSTQTIFMEPYDCIWIVGIFGLLFSLYMVFCSACTKKFPITIIFLIINVFSVCWMCMYFTVQQQTYGIILALLSIIFIVLFLIACSFCDVDFTRFKMILFTALLSFVFAYVLIWILIDHHDSWLPYLPRRENMLIFGVVVYSSCLVLMLQLILTGSTVYLADDDYTLGTFMLYMCVPCLCMKLLAYIGLYEENK